MTSYRVTLIESKVDHESPQRLWKFKINQPIGSAEIGITVPIFGHFFQKLLKLKNSFRANEVSNFKFYSVFGKFDSSSFEIIASDFL